MGIITTHDGTQIFYKDWSAGQPIVFSHGWPLNADAWDEQLLFFASRGYRAIAHDRRGHGRSSQPWDGNDMNTYADDLAALTAKLDLQNAIHVGHSTGGGDVARYISRHTSARHTSARHTSARHTSARHSSGRHSSGPNGSGRVAKAVLVGAVTPLMLKTQANPAGQPREVFDVIRNGVATDRSQFYKDLSAPFYGANRPGSTVSQGLRDQFWLQSMQAGLKAAYDCVREFSETDFTEDLKAFDVPTLFIHGDDDQIVPIGASALMASKIVKGSELKIYAALHTA